MADAGLKVRIMEPGDFGAVVAIDEKVSGARREDYYEMKFEKLVYSNDYVPTSLVAEGPDGTVAGFVMGQLFIGEYGISQEGATLDTIGVAPEYRGRGVGELLLKEFFDHLQSIGVKRVNTLVDRNDARLTGFFTSHGFAPSTTVNLELSIQPKR